MDDAAYLRALADEFEEGVLGGAHPDKIAAALRGIADRIEHPEILLHYDGSICQNPTCGWGHRPALIE